MSSSVWVKKVGAFVLIVGVTLGVKMWNKSSSHDELRSKLIDLCASDAKCLDAVDTHFDRCYEGAYTLGSKRRAGRLDSEKFLGCFNAAAGAQVFSVKNNESEG